MDKQRQEEIIKALQSKNVFSAMSTIPKSCVRGHWRVPDPTPRATRLFLVGYCPGNSSRAGVMQQLWIYRAARHRRARSVETVIMGEPAQEQAKTVPTEDISRRYAIEQTRMRRDYNHTISVSLAG
jgi:hypothetical protein